VNAVTRDTFARVRVGGSSGPRVAFARIANDRAHVLDAAPWAAGKPTGESFALADVALLTPVAPSKIVCVARNYRAHAKELGNDVPAEPMLFFKPPSSLLDPGGAIELPSRDLTSRVDYESEIALVIGARLRRASVEEARAAIFGVTLAFDVTARDLQKKDGQWWRAKGFDTFCPVGPVIVTGLDPSALALKAHLNGELKQDGHARDMIFPPAELLAFVSRAMTLEPGDVVLTGTPEGVGPLAPGDALEMSVEEVGALRVTVVNEAEPG
jgi:2-keto-4-pentenoate hydratase/2-oxohepta-3-ene-1,7-dioic acid hydratase in catechol pathway